MRQLMPLLVVALTLASVFGLQAAEPERCSALATPAERIVCYDRQFPPDATPAPTPQMPVVAPEPVTQSPPQSSELESAPVAAYAPLASSQPGDEPEFGLRRPVDAAKRVHEASVIKSIHRRDRQSMVFLLENEQIWLQDSERALPFHVGDAVTIKSGTFGGYFLTSDSGTKTRVRRIK